MAELLIIDGRVSNTEEFIKENVINKRKEEKDLKEKLEKCKRRKK